MTFKAAPTHVSETYLKDPVIAGHVDRRLVLIAQLIGTAQSQITSAYWNHAKHGATGTDFLIQARTYLRDALELIDTVPTGKI
jgi:hypothetical protein